MTSPSQQRLLHAAVVVLRRRATRTGGYAGLSAAGIEGLCATLVGVADGRPELDGIDRHDAACLAHRVLDDDHPEDADMWPHPGRATG